jgi:hypothetical protein
VSRICCAYFQLVLLVFMPRICMLYVMGFKSESGLTYELSGSVGACHCYCIYRLGNFCFKRLVMVFVVLNAI